MTVNYSSDAGGMALGDKLYGKGSPVELTAYPTNSSYRFTGWFVNDVLVETGNTCRFTARENISIHAGFQKKSRKDNKYAVEMGESYEEFARADIYKNDSGSQDIALRLGGSNI